MTTLAADPAADQKSSASVTSIGLVLQLGVRWLMVMGLLRGQPWLGANLFGIQVLCGHDLFLSVTGSDGLDVVHRPVVAGPDQRDHHSVALLIAFGHGDIGDLLVDVADHGCRVLVELLHGDVVGFAVAVATPLPVTTMSRSAPTISSYFLAKSGVEDAVIFVLLASRLR